MNRGMRQQQRPAHHHCLSRQRARQSDHEGAAAPSALRTPNIRCDASSNEAGTIHLAAPRLGAGYAISSSNNGGTIGQRRFLAAQGKQHRQHRQQRRPARQEMPAASGACKSASRQSAVASKSNRFEIQSGVARVTGPNRKAARIIATLLALRTPMAGAKAAAPLQHAALHSTKPWQRRRQIPEQLSRTAPSPLPVAVKLLKSAHRCGSRSVNVAQQRQKVLPSSSVNHASSQRRHRQHVCRSGQCRQQPCQLPQRALPGPLKATAAPRLILPVVIAKPRERFPGLNLKVVEVKARTSAKKREPGDLPEHASAQAASNRSPR